MNQESPGEFPDTRLPESPKRATGWRNWLAASAFTSVVLIGGVVLVNHFDSDPSVSAVDSNATNEDGSDANDTGAFPGRGSFGSGANGEVIEIDGSTLTVESTDPSGETSTVVVETSDDTVVSERVEGSVDDLTVGETVVVIGEETDSGISASTINVGGDLGGGPFGGGDGGGFAPPGGGELPEGFEPPEDFEPPGGGQGAPGGFTSGEITAVDGDTITIETSDGESVTVTIVDDTTVMVNATRSVSDIETGDMVRVMGETADSVVTAESIVVGDIGFGPGGFGGPGRPGAPTDTETAA